MKISVVTISFNQAKFLRECIDSVLDQNYPDIEYIIVDPGSTDESRSVIDSYGGRVRRLYEKDSGPADGLNKGFGLATGDVFCYLNSDDAFLPEAFSTIASYFESHGDVDVVCGHAHIIDGKSNVKRAVYSDKFCIKAAAYGATTVIQPSTFIRKEIFHKVGGFNGLNRSNWDGELLIDMGLAGAKIRVLNRMLSCYRVHDQSITGTGRLEGAHAVHSKNMFRKIIGRPFQNKDIWFQKFFRMKKHLLNPRATLERILHGPVFGTEK